jgi:hypothetical protein
MCIRYMPQNPQSTESGLKFNAFVVKLEAQL